MAAERRAQPGVKIVGPKLVAGDLFLDEAVVGLVLVERLDDVVPIAPNIRADCVIRETIAFRIASQIKPVPSPALPISR